MGQPKDKLRALRTLFKSGSTSLAVIKNFVESYDASIKIIDIEDRTLLEVGGSCNQEFHIISEDVTLATLYSDRDEAKLIADMISEMLKKEIDKRRIGLEVLGLYREINMIYDLSEQISEKIDAPSIAEVALKEASNIIDCTNGLFLLYEEKDKSFKEIASFGDNPNSEEFISAQNHLLVDLVERGTSSVVTSRFIRSNPALQHLKSVLYAPLKVKNRTLGLVLLGHMEEVDYTAAELKLLTTITLQAASAIESANLYEKSLTAAREREESMRILHEKSQKFVPSEFIKSLGKNNLTEVALDDQVEREVTVVFADIRGFTTLSEKLSPSENFSFINSFNSVMGPIIRRHRGFIMQYLGDGFMAIFPGCPEDALEASVEMHQELQNFNERTNIQGQPPINIGIGMQSGSLIMGITGDIERLDAAIISDTVNTASRIEGLSKYYGSSILLTGTCKEKLNNEDKFNFRYLGPVRVSGKQKSIEIYECIDGDHKDLFQHKIKTLNTFKEGLSLYFKKEFAMAAVTFQKVAKRHQKDKPAKLFLNKSAQLITQEISEEWKGVESMLSK